LEGVGARRTKALRTVGRGLGGDLDPYVSKEHLSLSGTHSNIICLHKGGPGEYFNIKILYDKTFERKVCVVAGEGCSYLTDHPKLRRAISLLDGLGT